jgi:FkbM family methyltransferase
MTKGFLYRRLANFIPCVLPGIGGKGLSLRSKYDVASARDVFFSAHYWRLFEFVQSEARLVVDLGAHCGHFSVLCHLLLEEKFGRDPASYVLVEPDGALLARAQNNLSDAGIINQASLHQGLVGKRSGASNLNSNQHNLLASSVSANPDPSHGVKSKVIPFLDLGQILSENQTIDVLKIDIEGSEREFLTEYPEMLSRTKVLLIELHGDAEVQLQLHEQIVILGMKPVSTPILRSSESMRIYIGAQG